MAGLIPSLVEQYPFGKFAETTFLGAKCHYNFPQNELDGRMPNAIGV
jgi:hypothetical protein